jgi:cytochrome d ubiquinol oxidase subunit II
METLYLPLFLAAVGIIFRGSAFALRGEAATIAEARALGATFALSSVLVPFFLGATIGAVASGQVTVPADPDSPFSSWTNATSIYIGALAVATSAYMAAVFVAADAVRAELPDLVEAFRKRALGAGIVTGLMAVAGIFVLREDARHLYDGLTSGFGLVVVIASALAGVATIALLWTRRFAIARVTSAAAVAAILVGLAVAISPDFLPGQLTLDQAAAADSTLIPLLGAVVIAVAVLVPSLGYLFKLVLTGQLDQEFHPIGASETKPESG